MNYLSAITAIAKNENEYLDEWINHHLNIGIEHIFIYDNNSDIPITSSLKEVTVTSFPGEVKQIPAYHHSLKNNQHCKWMAFIDIDEFIYPKSNLNSILKDFDFFGGLGMNWRIFGSNNHISKPLGNVLPNYTSCTKVDYEENNHIKSFVQMKYAERTSGNPHCFAYKDNRLCVSENREVIPNAWSKPSVNLIQLNHYFTKSLEEFKNKIQRGRADTNNKDFSRKLEDFYKLQTHCTETDKGILSL